MVYACRPTVHLGRNGAKLDEMVEMSSSGTWPSRASAAAGSRTTTDLNALYDQRKALVEEKGQLGTLFGRHVIDAVQLENATVELKGQIAEVDRRLAEATRISPVAMLLGDDDEQTLHDRWAKASPDIRSRIVPRADGRGRGPPPRASARSTRA